MRKPDRYIGVAYEPECASDALKLATTLRQNNVPTDYALGIGSRKGAKKAVTRFLNDPEVWCTIIVRNDAEVGFKRTWDRQFCTLTPEEAIRYILWLEDDDDVLPDPEDVLEKLSANERETNESLDP